MKITIVTEYVGSFVVVFLNFGPRGYVLTRGLPRIIIECKSVGTFLLEGLGKLS